MMCLFLLGDRQADINRRQKAKDERLNEGHKNSQRHEENRHDQPNQAVSKSQEQVLTGNGAKKPQRQRQWAHRMTDQLDDDHERR